jgi:hypothetical protein
MVGGDLGPTRQSRRERTKTTKALEQEEVMLLADEDDSNESGTERTIQVATTAPGAPRPTRTTTTPQPKDQAALMKTRISAAEIAERLATAATTANRPVIGKASTTTNGQNKVLTDLIASLLSAIEEQKQEQTCLILAMEEQKQAHVNQIESLTKMFTQHIEMLKAGHGIDPDPVV